jgi:predicted ATP-grasp superfamily ATP-dependent carboligase
MPVQRSSTRSNPAIIIGGGSANGLGIARNLGSHGIPVYCLTSNPWELTCRSKYCCGYAIIPSVEAEPTTLRQALHQLAPQLQTPAVLFPTTDTSLLTVSAIREELHDYVTFISPRKIVETLVLKSKFYPSLRHHGVPHPQTFDPEEDTLQHIIANVTFPVFIRPVQTLVYLQHFRGKGWIAQNPRDLRNYIRRAHAKNVEVLVQQIIKGPATYGYAYKGYFDHMSRRIFFLAFQKIRQPIMFSNCTVHKSIPRSTLATYEPVLLNYMTSLGYTGLFGIEFKRDPDDGQYKLLDFNARSTGDSAICTACGVNDTLTAYHDALGEEVHPQDTYQSEVYYITDIEDLRSLWILARQRQLTSQAFKPYLRRKQLHLLSRDDSLPLLREITRLLRHVRSR